MYSLSLLITITFLANIFVLKNQHEFHQVISIDKTRTDSLSNLVYVRGGEFEMGNEDIEDNPTRIVKVNSFYISKYEVTNEDYAEFLNSMGNPVKALKNYINIRDSTCLIEYSNQNFRAKLGYENHPVVQISWYGAVAYCQWRGVKYRLPTETEWEYVARGGDQSRGYKYAGSNNLNEVAWYNKNSYEVGVNHVNYGLHPIGMKYPNELGIYDMCGNAEEWCSNWYSHKHYSNSEKPINGSYRVIRGCSWRSYDFFCEISFRSQGNPALAFRNVGFRIAKFVD